MARTRRWVATMLLPLLFSLSAIAAAPAAAASTRILVYAGNGALNEGYTRFGTAAGKPVDTLAALPSDLSDYTCLVLPVNGTFTGGAPFSAADKAAFGAYIGAGGRLFALAEHSGFAGSIATMNDLAAALSADVSITSNAIDGGFNVTSDIIPSAFTAGVSTLTYAATSEVTVAVSGDAVGLARTLTGARTFMAADPMGAGLLVLSGDSNAWSDSSSDGYSAQDNGVLVANLCGTPANTPPSANAGGPYGGNEGSAIPISGTASDPNAGDTVTTTWSYVSGAGVDAGASCSFEDASSVSTTVTCTDDGTYALTLTADDGVNPPVASAPTNVFVSNMAPTVSITSPTGGALFAIGTPVPLSAPFADAGTNDTHSCTVNWDDGALAVSGTVTEIAGSGSGTCSSSKSYAAAGVYTITVAVTDDDGDAASASVMVIVYDPSAGFVTGGGWIDSPAGAYLADPALFGKANFGFVSKYKKGAAVPTGETEFQFHAGDFKFHSGTYQWLVVAGCKAQYKGTGTVNGQAGYEFLLTATDGDKCATRTTDKFRIKVWLASTSATVYDNKIASPDDIDGANPQAISGGQIVIHK